jgi:hypothetical protein
MYWHGDAHLNEISFKAQPHTKTKISVADSSLLSKLLTEHQLGQCQVISEVDTKSIVSFADCSPDVCWISTYTGTEADCDPTDVPSDQVVFVHVSLARTLLW